MKSHMKFPVKFHIPHTLKVLAWKQACWMQNSKCASHGILTLYMLLVKCYGYVEYKDWPHKRITKKNMTFWQFFCPKTYFLKFFKFSFGTVIKKQTLIHFYGISGLQIVICLEVLPGYYWNNMGNTAATFKLSFVKKNQI